MRRIALLVVTAVTVFGCSKEKQYKDDPMVAATLSARKRAKEAAEAAPPAPYASVDVTEVPAGRVLYNSRRGHVMHMHGVTIGGEPESLKIFRSPVWSPDGSQVLVSYFGGETNRFELGVTGEKGGDVIDVASTADHDSYPGSWSPDGRQIAYVQRDNNNGDIAILNVDGSGARVLDRHEADDGSPTWSPDGRTIAFESFREGESAVFTVPASGGAVQRVTREGEKCGQPSYSPDGDHLAYVVTYRSPETRKWVRDLRVRRVDGEGERTLAKEHPQIVGVDWSPEGQWLVYGAEVDGQSDLWIVDVNGEGARQITNDSHSDSSPSWSEGSD